MDKKENNDKIVTLINDEGREVEFSEIAAINYQDQYYAIMQPLEPLEDEDEENLVFLFKVLESKDGKAIFEMETDETIIEAVFDEFQKLYGSQESE